MYDALLSFDYKGLDHVNDGLEFYGNVAPRGDNIHLYLRDDVNLSHPNPWERPKMLGLRIQDFRYRGLNTRVQEERERLRRLREEMEEVRQKRVVDKETAPDGYVRLPLFGYRGRGTIETHDDEGHYVRSLPLYPSLSEEMRINVEWP